MSWEKFIKTYLKILVLLFAFSVMLFAASQILPEPDRLETHTEETQ